MEQNFKFKIIKKKKKLDKYNETNKIREILRKIEKKFYKER